MPQQLEFDTKVIPFTILKIYFSLLLSGIIKKINSS